MELIFLLGIHLMENSFENFPFYIRLKINHHIPAKDDLKLGIEGIGILKQIHEVPLHIGAQFRLHSQSPELGAHSSLKVASFDI